MKQIWSCGGGTQSCAIGALIIQGRLPRPDVCVIANTGRETQSTWDYLRNTLNPALQAVNLNVEIAEASELCYNGIDPFWRTGQLLIPAFSTLNEEKSKLSAFCSAKWKQEVIDRWLRKRGFKSNESCKWLGYGKEEQRRWVACMKSEDYKMGKIYLPLVHTVPLSRDECVKVIQAMSWSVPAPRSRCWMCPNQGDEEWKSLPPDEFQKAVEFEREMQKRDPHAWLHRSGVTLDKVKFDTVKEQSRPCDSGVCFI